MNQSFWAASAARALLLSLLLVVFVASIFIAGASLHDPDTCWLLALGKRIVETGALPDLDPFSFTMQMLPAQKFILYQWLTEVLFYLSYKALNLTGLLLLVAVVLTTAFVSIPLALARKIQMPAAYAIVGVILTLIAAFFHFLARPEIFSYLLLGIYVSLTHIFLRGARTNCIDWKAVIIFGGIMVLWCNLHSGFVLGQLYLGVFAIVTSAADFIHDKKLNSNNATALLSLLAALLASFINPYGVGLWVYLPKLFFMPLNKFIVELRPLSGKDFLEWTYYPFFILSISSCVAVFKAFQQKFKGLEVHTPRGQVVFAAINFIAWTVFGILCRRIIPFGAVCLFAEAGYMLALLRKEREAGESNSTKTSTEGTETFWSVVDRRLESSYQPHGPMWFITIAALSCIGVYFVATRIPEAVSLPQSSGAMKAPIEAVKYLAANPPKGNVFNDPQFGDVMIWNMSDPLKVFIDTRFDMYGVDLCSDYRTIYATQPGWEDLLKRYDIAWIFVRPDADVAKQLKEKAQWKTLYSDSSSIILQRP